jgi:hypothetical protein
MRLAKLPDWVEAIGARLANRFDVSHTRLPAEMDLLLRLIEGSEYREKLSGRPSPGDSPAGTADGAGGTDPQEKQDG